ncbi:MAG: pectate lyase [Anaerolineales bacterium]|nr:pectate lyase [Anaerolineales bacterium]
MTKIPTVVTTVAPTAVAKPTETKAVAMTAICKWVNCLAMPTDWYGSAEAVRIADNLLLFQRNVGGWQKDTEMAGVLTDADKTNLVAAKTATTDATIDNNATINQVLFLARVYNTTKQTRFKDAAIKGMDYVLAAQYPSGGWPQFYPNLSGYYGHITFNDNAIVNVLNFLRGVVNDPAYSFIDQDRRDKAAEAIQKGIDVILKTQIVVNGKKTAWCAQHDAKTLAPAAARAYELPSISGQESVGIVRFLMGIDKPSPEVIDAIQSAIKWFNDSKLTGIQVVEKMDPAFANGFDRVVVENPNAPPLWGRFYEIGTNKPFFVGRDGVKKNTLAEIEQERRSGYAYYATAPVYLLATDYPAWQKKWAPDANVLKQAYVAPPTATPRPTVAPTATIKPSPTLAAALTTIKPNVPASLNFPAGSIVVEAESTPKSDTVRDVQQPGASGSTVDVAKGAKALYEVELPAAAGNCWYVWVRFWATDANMDSFWIGMDNATPTIPEKTSDGGYGLRIFASPGDSANTAEGPYKIWFWDANMNHTDPRGCFQVTGAGKYRLWVIGRETGTLLDQILLTPDKNFDVEQVLKGAPIIIK